MQHEFGILRWQMPSRLFASGPIWPHLRFFSCFQQRQWRNQIVSLGEDKGTSPLKMCHNGIASGPARGVCWRWETCVTYDHNIGLVLLCKFIVTIWYIFYYINVRHNMYTLFKRPFEYKWWYISFPYTVCGGLGNSIDFTQLVGSINTNFLTVKYISYVVCQT